jgi:hypothetical protein
LCAGQRAAPKLDAAVAQGLAIRTRNLDLGLDLHTPVVVDRDRDRAGLHVSRNQSGVEGGTQRVEIIEHQAGHSRSCLRAMLDGLALVRLFGFARRFDHHHSPIPLDHDFAEILGLDHAPLDDLVEESAVLLLVLDGEHVRIRLVLDDQVLLAGLWINLKMDDELGHGRARSIPGCSATTWSRFATWQNHHSHSR